MKTSALIDAAGYIAPRRTQANRDTGQPSRHATLQEDTNFRVLSEQPALSQRQLAERLGITLGAVHYCLKALAAKGHIKVQNFAANPYKLQYSYLLTPSGLRAKAGLARDFLNRKLREYAALEQEIESLRREVGGRASPMPDWVGKPTSRSAKA